MKRSILFGLVLITVIGSNSAYASTEPSKWIGDEEVTVTPGEYAASPADNNGLAGCKYEDTVLIEPNGEIKPTRLCSVHGSSLSIGAYKNSSGYNNFAIKAPNSFVYSKIDGISDSTYRVYYSGLKNKLIIYDMYRLSPSSPPLLISSNPLSMFIPKYLENIDSVVSYEINHLETYRPLAFIDSNELNTYHHVRSIMISDNYKYVVVNIDYKVAVKIDIDQSTETVVSDDVGSLYGGSSNPVLGMISNDGRYMYVDKYDRIYDLNNCGIALDKIAPYKIYVASNEKILENQCKYKNTYEQVSSHIQGRYVASSYKFSNNDKTLSFNVEQYLDQENLPKKSIKITSNVKSKSTIDYLALGDSYSSGEGNVINDLRKSSLYITGTEGVGGCHLSPVSYPFLLRDSLGLTNSTMKSVACGGAMADKDYYGELANYLGQNQRLKDLSVTDRISKQTESLEKYLPGNIPQLEFVKKDKPAIVTLTGGGNDVEFGKLMVQCAGVERLYTCGYANKNSNLHRLLASNIATRYEATRTLIRQIKLASPDTTIYLVGYPSFIAEPSWCPSAAFLNRKERYMVNQSVNYLNNVIKAAAASEGAVYRDTETSLYGGRICEKDHFVTGIQDVNFAKNRFSEAFHPNGVGHQKMAAAILSGGIATAPASNPAPVESKPIVPEFFNVKKRNVYNVTTVKQALERVEQSLRLNLEKFKKGTNIEMTIDDTTTLSQLRKGADEAYIDKLRIPTSVSDGPHTLTVKGTGISGEQLETFQYVEIQAPPSADSDQDGVKNANDKCPYISSYTDDSGRVVCGKS